MLSRLFPNWLHFARPWIEWIWDQRGEDGYWDFGPRSSSTTFFPLSEDWKTLKNRQLDWTTRALILLKRATIQPQD
jgi:hypothetical protein